MKRTTLISILGIIFALGGSQNAFCQRHPVKYFYAHLTYCADDDVHMTGYAVSNVIRVDCQQFNPHNTNGIALSFVKFFDAYYKYHLGESLSDFTESPGFDTKAEAEKSRQDFINMIGRDRIWDIYLVEDFVHYCGEGGQSTGHISRIYSRHIARNRVRQNSSGSTTKSSTSNDNSSSGASISSKYLREIGKTQLSELTTQERETYYKYLNLEWERQDRIEQYKVQQNEEAGRMQREAYYNSQKTPQQRALERDMDFATGVANTIADGIRDIVAARAERRKREAAEYERKKQAEKARSEKQEKEIDKWYTALGEAVIASPKENQYKFLSGMEQGDRNNNEGMKLYRQGRYNEAMNVFFNNANQGNAIAYWTLGYMYENGKGGDYNYNKALENYKKAAFKGHSRAYNAWKSLENQTTWGAKQLELGHENYNKTNYKTALEWYMKAADQNNPRTDDESRKVAEYIIGAMYRNGQGVAKSDEDAVKWYRKSAEKGYASAQSDLGFMYDQGYGVTQNYEEAAKWFKKAAESGNVTAQSNLGIMYNAGEGVSQNYAEAAKWWTKAAERGSANAQNNLGSLYENGKGVAQNYAEAIKWYTQAANNNVAAAQHNLGVMYETGRGVNMDMKAAKEWYRKAALNGGKEAENDLKELEANGRSDKGRYLDEFNRLKAAAESGDVESKNELGLMYREGRGVSKSQTFAAEWFLSGAQSGDIKAQRNIAYMYTHGLGVAKDIDKAVEWYNEAAKNGSSLAAIEIINLGRETEMTHLHNGRKHYNDKDKSANIPKAIEYYEKAATANKGEAYYYLGRIYTEGEGIPRDLEKSFKAFKTASELGHAESQYYLGAMYNEGVAVPQNDKEAFKWHSEAAEQGHQLAKYSIATMYYQGTGTPKDVNKALEIYLELANEKMKEAQYSVGMIYKTRVVTKGTEKESEQEAIKWLKKAAEAGDADAQFELGDIYEQGQAGVRQNKVEACIYYLKASEQEHEEALMAINRFENSLEDKVALAEAICYQGQEYLNSKHSLAMKLLHKSGEMGYSGAYEYLGDMYRDGEIVGQNYEKAITYYKKAVEMGDATTAYSLAQMYDKGYGIPQNTELAMSYYLKSAEEGHVFSQHILGEKYYIAGNYPEAHKWCLAAMTNKGRDMNMIHYRYKSSLYLGLMYAKGLGVERSYDDAYKWLNEAVRDDGVGTEEAKKALKKLKK